MNTSPHRELDDFFLVRDGECSEPVVTIRNTQGGVWLDYCYDRAGERVVFIDKPQCTAEAVIDRFGWNLELGEAIYVPYDALCEFLAARIKFYFDQTHFQLKPL